MNDIIKKICDSNTFVGIYTNRNDCEKFATGYIVACTDDEFLFHGFDNDDLDDGYFAMRNDAVFSIKRNTIYLQNMLHFIKSEPLQDELPKGYWMDFNLFGEILSLCKKNNILITIQLDCDMLSYGWVKSFDADVLEIEEVDSYGLADGVAYFRMEDIILIGFGGIEETRRARLSKEMKR